MAEALELAVESSVEDGAVVAGSTIESGAGIAGGEAEGDALARALASGSGEPAGSIDTISTIEQGKVTGPMNIDELGRVSIHGSNRLLVDWRSGTIQDLSSGNIVATLEGNTIYRITDSWGGRQPIAEILNSKLLTQSTLYEQATTRSTYLRILQTGSYVEIVGVNSGWYQLRLADGTMGWAFAPIFMTRYAFRDRSNIEKVGRYFTQPQEIKLINSILDGSHKVREDIHQLLPEN